MRSRRNPWRGARCSTSALLVLACVTVAGEGRADEVGSAIYVRTDTNRTTVIAPRLRVQAELAEPTRLDLIYAVDVWTSASVDIMASASRVPVTEQRDELDVSIDHELEDLVFTLSYRYSVEPDYVSHGGAGGLSYEFADNNAIVALGLSGSSDSVGKAGDPTFSRASATFGTRLSFTQVLGRDTVAQAMYELSNITGYQASPYRYVPIGGDNLCTSGATGSGGSAPLCPPEHTPGRRLRHAISAELRHALSDRWSLGGAYRFYLDDWGVRSHTLRGEAAFLPQDDMIVAARYRMYLQGPADFYRSRYLVPEVYMTSDKELSPMTSHRIALEADRMWRFADDRTLTTTLALAPVFYSYSDFILLSQITAFEVTASLVFVP